MSLKPPIAPNAPLGAGRVFFNVQTDYGARGDGVTDDTTAISNAISGCNVAGGGTVFFPPATYLYSSILASAENVTLLGDSGATLKSSLGKTANTIALQIIGDDITIDGLTFDFVVPLMVDADGASRQANAITIRVGTTNPSAGADFHIGATVKNCVIKNSRNTPINVSGYSKVKILDNTLTTALGNGIYTANCPFDVIISGNQIEDTGDDGIAILADAGLAALTQRVIITDNTIYKSYANGIDLTGSQSGVIDGNVVEKTWANGIFVWHDTLDSLGTVNDVVISDNNVLKDCGQYYGPGQYKTSANPSAYGVKVANDTSRIVVGYPIINNPLTGAINMAVTGSGAVRRGQPMPQRVAASNWIRTNGVTTSTATPAEATMHMTPVFVSERSTAVNLNIQVTGAGTTAPNALVRLGIYNDNGAFAPGALLVDGGTVDCTATGTKTATISTVVYPGLYWLAAACQNVAGTRPTVNCYSGQAFPMPGNQNPGTNVNAWTQTGVSGALPSVAAANGTTNTGTAVSLGF